MEILFLYTELADYTLACLKKLKSLDSHINITVVHYPVNPEAPFDFDFEQTGKFVNIKSFMDYSSFKQHLSKKKYDKIVCSGWINKWYLRYCRENRGSSLCILTLDNHWFGSPKQQILRLISRITLRAVFHKIWVPGEPQVLYAQKLGFRQNEIRTGFYCCDTDKFNFYYRTLKERKTDHFPRRFLCVARYIPAKGYENLWKAFIEWKEETTNDWELWCVGSGEDFEKRIKNKSIKHLGFIQKDQWYEILSDTGIFVLPSLFEPWGVAVHEFACAGYPLLLSDKVGAASQFASSENAIIFQSGNIQDLKSAFGSIAGCTDDKLDRMASVSNNLGQTITLDIWAKNLLSF